MRRSLFCLRSRAHVQVGEEQMINNKWQGFMIFHWFTDVAVKHQETWQWPKSELDCELKNKVTYSAFKWSIYYVPASPFSRDELQPLGDPQRIRAKDEKLISGQWWNKQSDPFLKKIYQQAIKVSKSPEWKMAFMQK